MTKHGDSIISGVTEERPEARPKCGYRTPVKLANGGTTKEKCNSEDGLKSVSGTGKFGYKMTTPVCKKHLPDAIRDWSWEKIDPL